MELFYILIIFTIIISAIFMLYITSKNRKEKLEIMVEDNYIYFLISGDEYLQVKKSNCIETTIKDTILRYKKELASIINGICFIKYDNPKVKEELYKILNLK